MKLTHPVVTLVLRAPCFCFISSALIRLLHSAVFIDSQLHHFRRYNGSRREYPIPSVPVLGESGLQRPRGSSGGTASRFHRLIQQVHQLVSATRSGGLFARLGRSAKAPRTPEGSMTALPPVISRPFARDPLRAARPYHRQHHSHRLSVHTGTVFPPPAQSACWQQSRHRNPSRGVEKKCTKRMVPPLPPYQPSEPSEKGSLATPRLRKERRRIPQASRKAQLQVLVNV